MKNIIAKTLKWVKNHKVISIITTIVALAAIFVISIPFRPTTLIGKPVEVSFEIEPGSSYSQVIDELEAEGLIDNPRFIYRYGKIFNLDEVQAGTFYLTSADSPSTILKQVNGMIPTGDMKIVVVEGMNLEQIAEEFATAVDMNQMDVENAWDDEDFVNEMCDTYPDMLDCDVILNPEIIHPLEGYLYPATYSISDSTTPEEFANMMLEQMNSGLETYYSQMEDMGLTVHETLTLASIIQKETNESGTQDQSQRENISSVFWNRYEIDMPLQSDTTVNYFLNDSKVNLSESEMYTESAYSTYTNPGLPVGPIASPEMTTVSAALNPSDTSYLYFYASPEGDVYFTETYEEHLKVKEEHPWPEGS